MSQYGVQIADSVINIIDNDESQRMPPVNINEAFVTELPQVQSSIPETSFGYCDQPESMWPLFPAASCSYFYGAQRMGIFHPMNQRQLPGYPIPSIQCPGYVTTMATDFPVAPRLTDSARSQIVNAAETYKLCSRQECMTTHVTMQASKTSETEPQGAMSRRPNCARCRNHDFKVAIKGHKKHCPFKDCECDKCILIKERQVLMKKQDIIKRQYRQRAHPEPNHIQTPELVKNSQDASRFVATLNTTESHLPPIKRRKLYGASGSFEMST